MARQSKPSHFLMVANKLNDSYTGDAGEKDKEEAKSATREFAKALDRFKKESKSNFSAGFEVAQEKLEKIASNNDVLRWILKETSNCVRIEFNDWQKQLREYQDHPPKETDNASLRTPVKQLREQSRQVANKCFKYLDDQEIDTTQFDVDITNSNKIYQKSYKNLNNIEK